MLARASDGESFFVEQLLDAQHVLDVFAAIHALSGIAFDRFQQGEFSFPEAQDVGGQAAELGDFADAEVELFRNDDFRVLRRDFGFGGHRSWSWKILSLLSACVHSAPQPRSWCRGPRAFAASTFHCRDIGLGALVRDRPSAVSSAIQERATTEL